MRENHPAPTSYSLAFNLILGMHADERKEFLDELATHICMHCGSDDPTCQCWNDE